MTRAVNDADAFLTELSSHLEGHYGILVTALFCLGASVFRVDQASSSSWIARVFPKESPPKFTVGANLAKILKLLKKCDFPAERCAHEKPVSVFRGQEVLVTEYLDGDRPKICTETFWKLGDMLGRLHKLPFEEKVIDWQGGAWHRLTLGGPEDEIAAALTSLLASNSINTAEEQAAYTELQAEFQRANRFKNLPRALIHPDFVPVNIIELRDQTLIPIDWAGSGHGPRVYSLGWSVFGAGCHGRVMLEALITGYRSHISMEAEELSILSSSIFVRQLSLACWEVCYKGRKIEDVIENLPVMHKIAQQLAEIATLAFAKEGFRVPTSDQSNATITPQTTEIQELGLTGVFTAAIRAEESKRLNRLFDDPLAEKFVSYWKYILPDSQRVEALRKFIVARTVFFDELILSASRNGCRQIVLLGAGMDSRAFRLPINPGTSFFELDNADVLDNKSKILEGWPGSLKCRRVAIPCDLRSDWTSKLIDIGFDVERSTSWIIEGVSVYLEEDTVNKVISAITSLSAPGSMLGLDMASNDQSGNMPWRLGRSTAPLDPLRWLNNHGWEARISYTRDVLLAHSRGSQLTKVGKSEVKPKPRAILIEATLRP